MSDAARETLEVDVLYVGAGPANLASAYRLAQKVAEGEMSEPPMIAIIEKSADVGHHILSGAVLDPKAMRELFPDFDSAPPFQTSVTDDKLLFLTEGGKLQAPFLPPILNNEGKYVVSLSEVVKWMAEKVTVCNVCVMCVSQCACVCVVMKVALADLSRFCRVRDALPRGPRGGCAHRGQGNRQGGQSQAEP